MDPIPLVTLQNTQPTTNSPSATYCSLTASETAARLRTSLTGGIESAQDASYRRNVHGANELAGEEKDSIVKRFFQQFYENPLIILLLASAGISFLMGNFNDAVSITAAILIVVTVGFVQEYRSEKSLEALTRLVPHHAHIIRGPHTSTVMASTLVPGDLVTFSVGDRIPADLRISKSVDLEIDESNLTGENDPVAKHAEPVDSAQFYPGIVPVNERKSVAFMGTLVRHGNGSGIVIGTGNNTEFGAVFAMMSDIAKPKTPLQQSMDKLGQDLSYMSFAVIAVICIIGVFQGRHWLEMFTIGVSLAVAAIPEGLPIIVTVTLALGVLRMAKRRVIMRRLPSVETLGCVNVICSDKTGTLTMNHMTISKLWTAEMSDPTEVRDGMDAKSNVAMLTSLLIGSNCNNSQFVSDEGKYIGSPTDIALAEVMEKFGLEDVRPSRVRVQETPFSSTRKWMGVATKINDTSAATVHVKGAFEIVLKFCTSVMAHDGKAVPLDEKRHAEILAAAEGMARQGLRVIGFATASGESSAEPANLTFTGLMGMFDPPRKDVAKSLWRLTQGGVKIIMITGDSEVTATSIAKNIGLPMFAGDKAVMKGETLDQLSEEELQNAISSVTVFARATPEHKLKIVRALQGRGDVVAMTGDGVNDAPALKMADIGISMGIMGTDVAKEAADMILTDDDFSTILSAIEEGKAIFSNIQNFITFQLSTSIAALTLVALATTVGLPNPLNAMQILWINILMDGPPAQSLGVEPVDPAIMTRPPRQRNAKILTAKVLKRCLQSAVFIVIGTLFVYRLEMKDGVVTSRDTTMTFTCFVFFDMFNALACRSEGKSVFKIGLFSNKIFNLAVAGSLLGQAAVIYVPFLQRIFQTEALALKDLATLACLTSTVLIGDEVRKFVVRRKAWAQGYSTNV
ncbi:uncharacterized protein V1510DRAFT_409041 [Dipodascopsis tothii]|uniref:uncharacterized protein n=1 Tax=Dipodascopsis tothii TaxID=44089 RepID=UPI0034CF0848